MAQYRLKMKTYEPPITKLTIALYGGVGALLIGAGIISYIDEQDIFVLLLLTASGLLSTSVLIIPYRASYHITDDSLVCRYVFGRKEIPLNEIQEIRAYHLPLLSIRRFGISLVGGRYSNKEVGKFYAIFGGKRDGLLVLSDALYGGKIYITPGDEDDFMEEMRSRTHAVIER